MNSKESIAIITGGRVINAESLVTQLAAVFKDWTDLEINQNYWEKQFFDPFWAYDGETTRENPAAPIKEADSPRDIVDWGDLYRSGRDSYNFDNNGNIAAATWEWNATNRSGRYYAYYVHEGHFTNATPRRWTEELVVPAKFNASEIKRTLMSKIQVSMGGPSL